MTPGGYTLQELVLYAGQSDHPLIQTFISHIQALQEENDDLKRQVKDLKDGPSVELLQDRITELEQKCDKHDETRKRLIAQHDERLKMARAGYEDVLARQNQRIKELEERERNRPETW